MAPETARAGVSKPEFARLLQIGRTSLRVSSEKETSMSFNTGGTAILLAVGGQAVFAQPYRIGPNVQVSASYSTIRHYETFAGADPKNAKHLIACAYAIEPDGRIDNFFYVSVDSGKSWSRTLVVP